MSTIHVVSHTHWDREWYHPAVRFRQLLVAMVDELLNDPPRDGASFLLDGQTVVIDDYLDVRPERSPQLIALLKSGALEAGPWFVQADELIPGGEALVRNLLAGRRRLRALGVNAPPVLYCPDTFGHPAALPALAYGFGCQLIIASRGYGGPRWPTGDSVWWNGPGRTRALFHHLSKSGYETGAQLPTTLDGAAERWPSMRDDLLPRSALDTVLMMNGADHHARQANLAAALAALIDVAHPHMVLPSSLTAFAVDLVGRASLATLPEISGELRDSYGWMWTLQGTFATRAHQKRRNARLERRLARDVEPWVALASRAGHSGRKPLVHAAWRSLILCHPHDTICGCSIDEVARAMDARLDEADSQSAALRQDAVLDCIKHDRESARVRRDDWKPVVVIRNRAARVRRGVAIVTLTNFLADVKVGIHADAPPAPEGKRITPSIAEAAAVQVLSRGEANEMTESPRHYPDDDTVAVTRVAAWISDVPAYGVRCFAQTQRTHKSEMMHPAAAETASISNGLVSVAVDDDGRVTFRDIERDRTIANAVSWESVADLGDLYTPSPRGPKFAPAFAGARVLHRGPVRAEIAAKWTFRDRRERVDATVRFIVDANAAYVRIEIDGENDAADHRLRLRIATDVASPRVYADAMFGAVERVQPNVPPEDAKMETPLRTAPLHRYVSLFGSGRGATVYSDGLAEYEATSDGGVLISLVRAVGALSRIDLPERPGNAGWPMETPDAQCRGPFAAELALKLHDARSPRTIDDIERAADDILLPLTGATLRSALELPEPVVGVELRGEGFAFGCAKESDDGEWMVLRCTNLIDEERAGSWRLGFPVTEARATRLDETPERAVEVLGPIVQFLAAPRETVTILVR